MCDVKNQQEVTVSLMGHTAFGADFKVPYIDVDPSDETPYKSNELTPVSPCYSGANTDTVSRVPGNVTAEIDEFIPVVRRYFKNIHGRVLQEDGENEYRQLFANWNTFLQLVQGIPDTPAIISLDIYTDVINQFIPWQEELEGAQCSEGNKRWIKRWLPRWNMFLQARAGDTLVQRCNLFLTIVGLIFYIIDTWSDIGTSVIYASNGQWGRAMLTLAIIYGTVIIYTVWKWISGQIHRTSAVDWLRYIGMSLVNWPDVKQYGTLCRLEWQLHKSPASSAHLVPEWHQRRGNITQLKFSEGVSEACPQAILQLYLLVPDLYGVLSWTDYFRITAASVSLCTAGAALVNWEKYRRIAKYTDVPLRELVVLNLWAVPVTVSRLLSVTLLLSVHPYWALAGVALHLVLRSVYWCRTVGIPRTLDEVNNICSNIVYFLISPFGVDVSITDRRVRHAIHFLGNTVAMVGWVFGTPLVCAHSVLYSAIIYFNAVMFAVGLVSMEVHANYWPDV